MLTQSQLGIYIDSLQNEASNPYHNPRLMLLRGVTDPQALADAIGKVIAAHPAISAVISLDDDSNPVWRHGAPVSVEVERVSHEQLMNSLDALILPFNLEGGALSRIKIFDTDRGIYLFMDFHHTIYDGVSRNIFLRDIARALNGEELQPEETSIFDLGEEEAARRKSADYELDRDAWTELLKGAETETDLIPDVNTPATGEYAQLHHDMGIDAADYEAYAKRMGMPRSVPATAVFSLLISRLYRRDDVTFATIYHGRDNSRYDHTFAMMVRSLPVRAIITKETTVASLLEQVKRNLGIVRKHSLYSFAEAAQDFGINSDLIFAYQGEYNRLAEIAGYEPEQVPLKFTATGAKITLNLNIINGRLVLTGDYRADLYSSHFMQAFASAYSELLRSMMRSSGDTLTGTLSSTDEAEMRKLERFWYGGEGIISDKSATIPSLFAESARRNPDNVAVVYDGRSLTYRELDSITDALAAELIDRFGIRRGDRVGVMIERSELMAVYPLAIMKAGAAYMPLDPYFPQERLEFMVEDAGLDLILADTGIVAEKLPAYSGRVFEASSLAGLPKDAAKVDMSESELPMVILYTSGSTGKPKGVELTQHNIVNFCGAYIEMTGLCATDRTGAYAAFGFDAHIMDLYPTLISGATVHIFSVELRMDLTAMHDYIETQGITVMFMTTQIAWQMATLFDFTTLRILSGGGEKLPPLNPLPYRFCNAYGPTECSVFATAFEVTAPTDGRIIGRPIPGYEVRILDRDLNPLPAGLTGEIVIMGDGVGVGYLNRPDLTAEKFITIDGVKAYRTGDQGRYTADGEIEFIGRMDGMVKLRGLRIELGEIEAVATRHEAVKAFCAVVKEIGGAQNLVGYYTTKDGAALDAEALRAFMSESLTEFMVPSVIMPLKEMPLTPNGKIDRRALPVPEVAATEIVKPEGESETALFRLAADVLGHTDFGVTTNLLSVGLTSLMAMRLVAAIMKERGVKITAKTIMSDPTISGIASAVGNADAVSTPAAESPRQLRRYYPLTENQRGVYIDWEMNRRALQYNIPQAFRFADGTDPLRLRESVISVLKAHPGLLTRLTVRNGDVMQMRCDEMPEIAITELDKRPDSQFFQQKIVPFDLLSQPLIRCEIFTYGKEVYMLLDVHHIIFDGVSAMVFSNDLVRAYSGEKLTPESYTALDRALDERELMAGDDADKAREWFDSLIGDSEPTSYPHSRTPESSISGAIGRIRLLMDSTEIKRFCSANGLTPSNFLLSSFLQLLHRLIREESVQIVTVNNGRADMRLLNDTGMFVKTLPVVSRCKKPDMTPAEFAKGVQEQFLTSQDYDFYPFTELVSSKGVRPEIMYVFEGGISSVTEGALPSEKLLLSLDTAKVPLTVLIFEPNAGEYEIVVEYDKSLYAHNDMELLATMMRTLTLSLPEAATVADGKMVNDEQARVLSQVRDGMHCDVPYTTFHREMENRCDETPDAPAVIACDKRMTYREFDDECNRIANALIKRGVKPGDRIVILLPRRSYLISSIYGAMKTGSAYIPCDPEYPVDRIRLITEDSDARYIITTADKVDSYPGKAIDIEELLKETDTTRPGIYPEGESVAYMIYTSGSTGRPKGVMIPQRAICNYVYGYRELFYRNRPEVKTEMLIVTISFDASLNNLGVSLTSGHALVLANEEECKDVVLLSKLMLENHVDSADVTPSRLDAMLELPEFRQAISQCKHLNIGGEGFGSALINKLFAAGFEGMAVNEYGPTETTVGSNQASLRPDSPVVAGPPFVNFRQRIVDAWGSELPVGAQGELYIFGRGLGLGYNNLPEKTAEAYIDFHGERGYRTGDLAGMTPEGDVVIAGRIDHQVKLRGLRIELGEIEAVASRFEGIKQVAAAVREMNKIQHLCLYYTRSSDSIDKEALRAHLASYLTEYMVPDAYTEIEKMPLTPNGKINRKALPDPEVAPLTEYVEPEEGLEADIAATFAKILNSERIGANDDFFSIGGTSISAIKVVAALAGAGHQITYKNVFEFRTPRELSRHILGRKSDEGKAQVAESGSVSEFASVLDTNTLDALRNGERQRMHNVLLTGATGFMGIHMLCELLKDPTVKVICAIRRKKGISAETRLRTLLFYYFNRTFEECFESGRLSVIELDVTKPIPADELPADIDTVINCAANVKHFSACNDIEMVNVESVRNLIEYCLASGARLVHVSTVSVAGESLNGYPDPSILLDEHKLDFGQSLANQYVSSKYEAERLVLTNARDRGLNAKIMRVGNLSARSSDGEFQINFRSNAFMGKLRAYAVLGCAPYAVLDAPCEFSPIDEVCRAILALAATPKEMRVFQPCNNHRLPLGDVLHLLSEIGIKVKPVESDEFIRVRSEAMGDIDKVEALQPLMAYESEASSHSTFIRYDASYTNQVLYRLGFRWNYTSHDYVKQFLKAIESLNFFAL